MAMKKILVLFILALTCVENGLCAKKVLLKSVETVTLYSDKFTSGRRSSPILQLKCVDGKSSCKNLPSSVQCYNKGSDGIDIQWKCEAQLPNNVQFDAVQVECEGYDYPDDPYVLAGSCGLTYSLKPVGSGSSTSGSGHKRSQQHHHHAQTAGTGDGDGMGAFLVIVIFLGIALAIYAFCLAPNRPAAPSAPPGSDESNLPPPPYSETDNYGGAPQYGFRPEFTPGNQQQQQQSYNSGSGKYYQGSGAGHSSSSDTAGNNGGPGFWTGAAVGGVAGYLFGSSGSRRQQGDSYYRDGSSYHSNSFHRDASFGSTNSSTSSAPDETPVTRTGYATTRRR